MKVYQIMEYRNWDEHYSWGIYSSEENARLYLKQKGWDKCEDFEILTHVLDEKLNSNQQFKIKEE